MQDSPADGIRMAPGRVLAVANQKGGVGKTTTAINLGAALASHGHPVLLVDLDPQGNASTGLGFGPAQRRGGSYNLLLRDESLTGVLRETAIPKLSMVTAEPDLAGAELDLVSVPKREFRLRHALGREGAIAASFSFVLIDCPPSLNLLTINALVAADAVLVPLQCEFFALEGITQLTRTIDAVRRNLNPHLRISGIVLTMFDRRNNFSDLVAADVRGFFGSSVFETVIPRNIRVSEAPSHGKPVLVYDPRSAGAQAYVRLAAELAEREQSAKENPWPAKR